MKTLHDLFLETLRDIYYVERQLIKALPKMAKSATSPALSEAFAEHAIATESQIERLECVFGLLEKPARGKKCAAIEGLIAEVIVLMKEVESDVVRDAGLLAAAQAVEHYEISRYGTLKAWAEKLELKEVVELLDVTLEEEKATDQKFSVLAKDEISLRAEDQERPRAKSRAR